ncbi:MAG: indoleacetamide hydrolase [Burkholderiales bacterium]|nr:indoleacetamide hydrolase [Burkholderiales bacterium]
MAKLPKGADRLKFQQEINEHWKCLSDSDKTKVLEMAGQVAILQEISAPSKMRGPAISWLHSTLSAMNSNRTLQGFLPRLTRDAQDGLNAVLTKKPNRNLIDVDFDYKHFLKFNINPISLPTEAHGKEVAIIGSGISGAVAARLLLQAGAKPVIFERDSKAGGRLDSRPYHDVDGNKALEFSEMGGMRFPVTGRTWFHFLKQLNIKTIPDFPNPGKVPTALHFKNEIIDWPAGAGAPNSPVFKKIGADFSKFVARLVGPVENARKAHDTEKMQEIHQAYLDKYGDKTFYDALMEDLKDAGTVWSKDEIDAFGTLGIGTGGLGVFYPVSFMEILRVMVNGFEDEQHLLQDGATAALNKFYSAEVKLPDRTTASLAANAEINLRTQVTDISSNNGKPMLEFKGDDGEMRTREFAAVVVATTPATMQDMGLSRPKVGPGQVISAEAANAISGLDMVSSSKLFIRTEKKFWLDSEGNPRNEKKADGSFGPIPQNIQTDQAAHSIYCLDYPGSDHGIVLVNYTWGEKSDNLIHLSPEERLNEFKKTIAEVSPEFAANLAPVNNEIHCVDWQNQAGHYGAFKLNNPGREASQQAAFYQHQDNRSGVVLAGDSISHMGGWVEGALQTGIHAACAIAVHLGGHVAENSPLELNRNKFNYGSDGNAIDPVKASRMLELNASDAVEAIARGSVTAEEYMTVLLARAKALSGLNSIITLNEDGALAAAKEIDEARAAGKPLKRLAGLPIIVKDNINTEELPTTAGTPALKGFMPGNNAPTLQSLLDAGAIVLGKANMHELAFGITSTNLSAFAKPVRNPYNRDYMPGGSSGGTAAAIAARIVPAGLSTDTGGSSRIPAALTGIVGLRPSVGNGGAERRYSGSGVVPVSTTRDTVGPMGLTVKDVALLDSVIADGELPIPAALKGLRLGVPGSFWRNQDKEVASVMEAAKRKLSDAGVVFVDVDMPEVIALNDKVSFPVAMHEPLTSIPEYLKANGAKDITLNKIADNIASPDVRGAFTAIKEESFGKLYPDAINVYRPQLRKAYDDYFSNNNVDAVFFPTTPLPAVPIDFVKGSSTVSFNGGPQVDEFGIFTQNTDPGSNAGIPGLSLPAGMTSGGLPVGMEIDGAVGTDAKLLSIGMAMEALFGTLPAPKV